MLKVWYSEQYSTLESVDSKQNQWIIFFMVPLLIFAIAGFLFFIVIQILTQPPKDFPVNQPIEIETGMRVQAIADLLERQSVIKSAGLYKIYIKIFYSTETLKAGTYQFVESRTMPQIIADMVEGNYQPNLLRITHTEGKTVQQLAEILGDAFNSFSADEFLALAEPYEGQLFPETYFVPPDYSVEAVLDIFLQTYSEIIGEYNDVIAEHNLTEKQIITLASILEREANSEESMRMVSGILQNRLDIGMALQADATIVYILEKPLAELIPEDLQIDSPYNTYLYPGLPPTPIGNPGRQAIEAVLEPIESDYLYYITGNDGNFYYAESFVEHRRNIANYLQ